MIGGKRLHLHPYQIDGKRLNFVLFYWLGPIHRSASD